jgi:zinc transport system substrate-binding protein
MPTEFFEEVEEGIKTEGGDEEWNAEAQGIERQQCCPLPDVFRGAGKRENAGQHGPDAGRPAKGEGQANAVGPEQGHALGLMMIARVAGEKAQPEQSEEIETHDDDGDPRQLGEQGQILAQHLPGRRCGCPQQDKNRGEAQDETQGREHHPGAMVAFHHHVFAGQIIQRQAADVAEIGRHQGQHTGAEKTEGARKDGRTNGNIKVHGPVVAGATVLRNRHSGVAISLLGVAALTPALGMICYIIAIWRASVIIRLFTIAALLWVALPLPALAAPKVIASIVPVHALVAGVMDGVAEPELLLAGQTSEHQASFSPLQLKSLGEADLVFIMGGGLEIKLMELSGGDVVKGKRFVALSALPDLTRLPIRAGGAWVDHADHADEADHADHADHAEAGQTIDPHLWLDPENAKVMVRGIAAALAAVDPAHAQTYADNAEAVVADLSALTATLVRELAPVKAKPFIVFHDAFQYFERRFELSAAGSIADTVASPPSAKRLQDIRQTLRDTKAFCVFREPQFSEAAVKTVVEGSEANIGVLDPIGATLTPGKGAYRQLLVDLAAGLAACLSAP